MIALQVDVLRCLQCCACYVLVATACAVSKQVYERGKTGFEESKHFRGPRGAVIAGRYVVSTIYAQIHVLRIVDMLLSSSLHVLLPAKFALLRHSTLSLQLLLLFHYCCHCSFRYYYC
jgi:hypothetical protein